MNPTNALFANHVHNSLQPNPSNPNEDPTNQRMKQAKYQVQWNKVC